MMGDNLTLYHGDCLDIMGDLPDNSIDLILTDLPYGVTKNKWDSVIPLDQLWKHYERLSKGAIILTASKPFTSILITSNLNAFKHEWIWIKNRGSNFANTVREPMKEHESVLVFSYGKWTYNKQMQERTGTGIERINSKLKSKTKSRNYNKFKEYDYTLTELRVPSSWQKFSTEVGLHPTQKPVASMEYLIKTYSNEEDVVLDNCMGSGTTGVACIHTNRKFIGIEKDKQYFETAKDRISPIQNLVF